MGVSENSGGKRLSRNQLVAIELKAAQPDKTVRECVEQHAASRGLIVEFLLYRVQTKLLPHP